MLATNYRVLRLRKEQKTRLVSERKGQFLPLIRVLLSLQANQAGLRSPDCDCPRASGLSWATSHILSRNFRCSAAVSSGNALFTALSPNLLHDVKGGQVFCGVVVGIDLTIAFWAFELRRFSVLSVGITESTVKSDMDISALRTPSAGVARIDLAYLDARLARLLFNELL